MKTLEIVRVYAAHGGQWEHLEKALANEGMSKHFAHKFVLEMKEELSQKNSEKFSSLFEEWMTHKDEKVTALDMLLET